MLKKISLIFILIISFLNFSYADVNELRDEKQSIQKYDDNKKMQDDTSARNSECDASGNCFDRASFKIDTTEMFDLGGNLDPKGSNSEEKIKDLLGTLIQKMMIVLGILSLFIMTVGAGYIITYRGEDELLSKGKNIFMSGIIALVVALTSYYMVSLVRYIIYN